MPTPRLPLPDYPWTTAYRALVEVLKEDPDLKRVVRPDSWRTWDGTDGDRAPLSGADAPYVALMPTLPAIQPATESDYVVQFPVRLDYAVPGTNVDDLMNFMGAILQALRYDRPFRDGTVGSFFYQQAGHRHRVSGVGVAPGVIEGAGRTDLASSAVVTISLFVPS